MLMTYRNRSLRRMLSCAVSSIGSVIVSVIKVSSRQYLRDGSLWRLIDAHGLSSGFAIRKRLKRLSPRNAIKFRFFDGRRSVSFQSDLRRQKYVP